RRYSPRDFHDGYRCIRELSLAEEAAQETFLKAFSQLKGFEGRGSMEGWLTLIATNTCLNIIRATKRRPELVAADLNEDENEWLEKKLSETSSDRHREAENRRAAADLAERLLETLSPEDRLALILVDGEGASVSEVAAM